MHSTVDLNSIPLFAELSKEHSQILSRHMEQTEFAKGEYLFKEGTIANRLHIIMEGAVQLTAEGQGGQQTVLELLYPGDSFLLSAVLTAQPYLMSAKILEDALIVTIPGEVLNQLILEEGDFALYMLTTLSQQFRTMVRQVKDLRLRTTTQRLGAYLLELSHSKADSRTFSLPHTKRLVASWLGMSPERFSRSLNTLREYGVEIDGNEVRLLDPEKLRHYCGFNETFDMADN